MSEQNNKERRHFHRVGFEHNVTLTTDDSTYECELVDLSLRGALVEACSEKSARKGDQCKLVLPLDVTGETMIIMQGTIRHVEDGQIGIRCEEIDLDSIAHLRRLVEMNLGDPDILERDLEAMLDN